MNSAVANVLNRVLGDWIKDLNADQLSLSVFRGEVSLENLHLKENILHVLGLPFDLMHGTIGKIKVSIPWTSLLSSSLSIEISDVYAYLTPKKPSSWCEKHELSALVTAKESALQQFEAFSDSELKDASSPGYFANQAATIVNNVQVKINNIYIRYEDTISSSNAFAIGLALKSLCIQTCNSNWVPEYMSDCDVCYKIIKIEGFQLFCDYNVKIIKFQDYYKGDLDKMFVMLAQDDIKEQISHNYILRPFGFELKIVLSKKMNYDLPLADVCFVSSALFLEFYSGQIKILFKFIEFLKMYSNFKAGIIKNLAEHDFSSEDEILKYKELYQYWKNTIDSDVDKKNLENELRKMQENIHVDHIRRVRDEANKAMQFQKTVEQKLQEIEAIKNETPSLTSRFSGFLRWESKEDAAKREEEKQRRLETAKNELKKIMDQNPIALSFLRVTSTPSKDWQKFKFSFKITQGGFNLCHISPLLTSKYKQFSIIGIATETNIWTKIQMDSFTIKEFTSNNIYPYLFRSEEFCLEYNQNPMDVKICSGDALLCVKYAEVMEVVRIFSDAASAAVDVSEYVSHAGFKINSYIADGEKYLAGVITQGAGGTTLTLTLQLNAPKIILPSDTKDKKPYLVLNLGKMLCKTLTEEFYDVYNIKISEFESFIIWDWEELDKVTDLTKDYLLTPVEITTILKKANKNDYIRPGFEISLDMSGININLNEKKIELFFLLSKQFKLPTLPEEPKKLSLKKTQKHLKVKPMPQGGSSFLEPRNTSFISPSGSEKLSMHSYDCENNDIREHRGSIKALEEVEKMVPIRMKVTLTRLGVDIKEGVKPLTQFWVNDTGLLVELDCVGNVRGKVSVQVINVKDLRENAPFVDILANPNLKEINGYDDYQLVVDIEIRPKEHHSDLAVIMNDLRFTACKDFASALMTFYSTNSQKFSLPPTQLPLHPSLPKYFIRYTANTRYSLRLKTLEIWLPASERNSKVAQFNLSLTLIYISSFDISYTYSENNTELSRKYFKCEEQAYLTISHFGGYLLRLKKRSVLSKNKNLISPCRLTVEYGFNKCIGNICADMNIYVRIESICMLIGFKDLVFFKALGDNWAQLPKLSQEKKKQDIGEGQEDEITKMSVEIDGDAVQITLIDDVGRKAVSMLHMQISNMIVMVNQDKFNLGVRSEIIMFIDYFNKNTGAWEPALEDWKFITKYHIDYNHNHSQIILKSNSTFNWNLTQNLIDNLSAISSKISNPKHREESEDFSQGAVEHGDLVYEIHNNLGLELTAWLRIAQNSEKWTINQNPKKFTQGYVNRLHALSRKKAKSSLALNNIQAPTKLAFNFGDERNKSNEIIIEIVGLHMFQIQTNNFSFPCLIEIYVQGGNRIISFEPGVFVSNNSQVDVFLDKKNKNLAILPLSYQALPLEWVLDLDNVYIEGKKVRGNNEKPKINESNEFEVNENVLVCTSHFYKFDSEIRLQVIEINPPFFVKNFLHSAIEVYDEKDKMVVVIQPGEEEVVNISPDVKYYIKLITKELVTEPTFLFSKNQIKCKIKGHKKSSIFISSEEKRFENHKGLSKHSKNSKDFSTSSWLIKIYAEYVIVNKTQYDLVLSGLEIPINENCYYSSHNNKAQLKMKSFLSKYSEKFALDTIGVSGVVKITQTQDVRPKHFLFGINISQAPKPLVLSKVVTFVPRFMIWNYLDIPLCIKQYKVKDPSITTVKEQSSQGFSIQYHLDNYKTSRGLMVSDGSLLDEKLESLDPPKLQEVNSEKSRSKEHIEAEKKVKSENTWSAPFDLEVIEDLQIKFYSRETTAEKKLNVFQKGFYVPRSANLVRYVRVFIYSQDEATIHIAFLDPKDPDFRILNKTEDDIFVKQKGLKTTPQVVKKDSSLNWVWENNLSKKKLVEVKSGKSRKSLSLEKVEEDKVVKINTYEAVISVNGVTRELIIRKPIKENPQDDLEPEEESKTNQKEPSITIEKIPTINILNTSQYSKTYNPSKNKETSKLELLKSPTLTSAAIKSPIKSEIKPGAGFLNIMQIVTSSDIRIDLTEIGISTNDESNNELFYINFKNLKIRHLIKTTTFGVNKKITTQSSVRLEHFQVDYMGSNDKLIPVIVYPIRHAKEVTKINKQKGLVSMETYTNDDVKKNMNIDDGYKFFSLELMRESSYKLKRDGTILASMDKFDNIEILLREVQIRVNEETFDMLLKVKSFFNAFSNCQQAGENEAKPEVFSGDLPKIPFEPFSFQRKAYFNKVVIHAMKLFLTFKKAGSKYKPENEYDTEFPLIGVIKKLGGAFVNVSESPMSFTKVFIEHAFQTLDSFTWILIKKYMQQGIRQFYKIFGSIDIIGNPLGLIDNLGTGVYEFISAPAKGLVSKTPGSFTKGLSTGVKSLISGVVGGGFGSISKISGSLYNVLRTATGEEVVYQEITTENIGRNMAIGFKNSVIDIAHGIGGIVYRPYRGARAAGAKGFFKGFFLGTFGLITSPLKLVLKVSNVISTTIASTSILLTKGKIQKYGRTRFPRQIGIKNILEPYNKELAEAQALLKTFITNKKYKDEKLVFYSQTKLEKDEKILEDKNVILMVTSTKLWVVVDGEMTEKVKIDAILFLEFHVLDKIYLLCIASDKKNFSIASREFSKLSFVYNVILCLNDKLPNLLSHKFECPKYVNKEIFEKTKDENEKK